MSKFLKIFGFLIVGFVFLTSFSSATFAGNPPDQNFSGIYLDDIPADGQTTGQVTISLQDSSGNPITKDNVSISVPDNPSISISPSSATLDSTGTTSFLVKSSNDGTYNVNVTDSTTHTTLNALGQVYFYPVESGDTSDSSSTPTPTPGQCNALTPGDAAYLVSADTVSETQVKLTWQPASDPVTSYLVSYGLESGDYIYGGIPIGGHDATDYTVNKLQPGTTYYFAIKAVNGCAPGDLSNELPAATEGIPQVTTAVTNRQQTASAGGIQDTIGNTKLNITNLSSAEPTKTANRQNLNLINIIFIIICIILLICIIISFVVYLRSRNKDSYLSESPPTTPIDQASNQKSKKDELIQSIKQGL